MVPVTYYVYSVPSEVIGKEEWLRWWVSVWPWSKMLMWSVCLVLGHFYVSGITESRKNPFARRGGNYSSYIKFLIAMPFVFFIGPIRTLIGPEDGSQTKAFVYNYFGFFLFYLVGLQFTYLDYFVYLRYAGDKFGTPSLWKDYTIGEILLFVPIVLGIVGLIAWHMYLIISHGLIIQYLVFYGVLLLFFLIPTIILRKTHHLHVHHYGIFGSLIPFAAFPTFLSLMCLGILTGIYVEGIGRWGMGGFWGKGVRKL